MGFLLPGPHCAIYFPENQNGFYSEQESMQQLTNESVQPSFKEPWIEFDTRYLRAKHSNPLLEPNKYYIQPQCYMSTSI